MKSFKQTNLYTWAIGVSLKCIFSSVAYNGHAIFAIIPSLMNFSSPEDTKPPQVGRRGPAKMIPVLAAPSFPKTPVQPTGDTITRGEPVPNQRPVDQ